MSQEPTRLRAFLEENPKWIGALFSAMVLLSQVGTVAAANGTSYVGP